MYKKSVSVKINVNCLMIILFDDFISGSGNLIIHSPIDYEELEQKRLTFDLVVKVMISYVKTKLKSGLYTLWTWRQPTLLWKKRSQN